MKINLKDAAAKVGKDVKGGINDALDFAKKTADEAAHAIGDNADEAKEKIAERKCYFDASNITKKAAGELAKINKSKTNESIKEKTQWLMELLQYLSKSIKSDGIGKMLLLDYYKQLLIGYKDSLREETSFIQEELGSRVEIAINACDDAMDLLSEEFVEYTDVIKYNSIELKLPWKCEIVGTKDYYSDGGSLLFWNPNTEAHISISAVLPVGHKPFESIEDLIKCYREGLAENQGIVEVDQFTSKNGLECLYGIHKTLFEPFGVAYSLLMELRSDETITILNAECVETGMTGEREATIFALLQNQGAVYVDSEANCTVGWNVDPYDPEYNKGELMNLSEKREYDELFPEHPLSTVRVLVNYIKEYN